MLYELNEAFASVVLRYMQALKVRTNKNELSAGPIAMGGHPLGATGADDSGHRAADEFGAHRQIHGADHALHRRRHGAPRRSSNAW